MSMISWSPKTLRTVVAALGIALPSLAFAAEPAATAPDGSTSARIAELNESGARAYADRNYRAAIEKFVEAYAIDHDPNLLFNLARCYEKLGDLPAAIEKYEAFVAAPGRGHARSRQGECLTGRAQAVARPRRTGARQRWAERQRPFVFCCRFGRSELLVARSPAVADARRRCGHCGCGRNPLRTRSTRSRAGDQQSRIRRSFARVRDDARRSTELRGFGNHEESRRWHRARARGSADRHECSTLRHRQIRVPELRRERHADGGSERERLLCRIFGEILTCVPCSGW